MHFLLILYFLDFLVPFILIDNIKSVDELFFLFQSHDRYFIKITVVNFIPDFFNVLSSGFLSWPFSVYLIIFWDWFPLVFLSIIVQTGSVLFHTVRWVIVGVVFRGLFGMPIGIVWGVEISFFCQYWWVPKLLGGRMMRVIWKHGLPNGDNLNEDLILLAEILFKPHYQVWCFFCDKHDNQLLEVLHHNEFLPD